MWYEINVALHGQHFFATAERSLQSAEQLSKVYKVLAEKFPASEGYDLIIYEHKETMRRMAVPS